ISLADVKTIVFQAETNTINSVGTLFGLGARSLLFYEVPNLGLTPRFDGTALQSLASDLAESFNEASRADREQRIEGLYAGHIRFARRDQSRSLRIWLHE